jgi:hypothetical protein
MGFRITFCKFCNEFKKSHGTCTKKSQTILAWNVINDGIQRRFQTPTILARNVYDKRRRIKKRYSNDFTIIRSCWRNSGGRSTNR